MCSTLAVPGNINCKRIFIPEKWMTELTFENLLAAPRPLHEELSEVRNRVDSLSARVDGLSAEIADVRSRVDGLTSEMANVSVRVDGLPLLGVAVETLRQDVRMMRAAINDVARIKRLAALERQSGKQN
jgi:hypothetical protein